MRTLIALEDDEGHNEGAGNNRWMVSYADFITLLFVLFLALYARLPKLTEDSAAQPMGNQAQTAQDKRPASQHVENGHVASSQAEGGQAQASSTLAQKAEAVAPAANIPATPAQLPNVPAAAPVPAIVAQAPEPAPAAQPALTPQASAPAQPAIVAQVRRPPNYTYPVITEELSQPRPAAGSAPPAQAAPQPASQAAPQPAAQPAPSLNERLRGVAGGNVTLTARNNSVVLDIADTSLFASGTAQLAPGAQEVLSRIAAAIGNGGSQVIVEGHTDNLPIKNAQFPSNWELSSARAAAVARALQERGVDPARLTASGLANTRPRASNDSEEGRRANRRVSVIVVNG